MAEVIWAEPALNDLDAIADYIALDNPRRSVEERAKARSECRLRSIIRLHAINSELDHAILDSLAEQLYQFLSDNKMLNDNSKHPLRTGLS